MSYSAQQLNTKVTLARFEFYRDDEGVGHESWVDYGQVFAKVEPLVGREYLAAAQLQAEDNVKVTMRWNGDIQASDRLTMRGQHWNVVSVQNIRWHNRELLLYCKRLGSE